MRNAEVIRQWRILKRIEAGRYTTAQDLADEHGVTERTIRRDIEALQEAGLPALRRAHGRPQGLAPGRGLQAAADPDLHPGRAQRALLQQEPDVVPGRARPSPRTSTPPSRRSARPCPRAACPTWPASRTSSPRGRTPGRTTPRSRTSSPSSSTPCCTSGARHRLLLLQQQAHQDLHRRPLPARVLARWSLPLRAGGGVRRGAHLRRRAHREDRGAGRDLRDARGLQRLRIRARGLRHRRGQAGAGGDRVRGGGGGLHPRARLAREPVPGGRARAAA